MTYDLASILRTAHAKARGIAGTINLDGTRMSYRDALSRGLTLAWREAKKAALVAAAADRAPIRARATGRQFHKAVARAKALGGRFDAGSKTWVIPAERWAAASAQQRAGLVVVGVRHEPNCAAYYNPSAPCECH